MGNYRLQITIRRQGQPVFTSQEYKTENHDDLHDLLASLAEFVTVEIEDDIDSREGEDDTANNF